MAETQLKTASGNNLYPVVDMTAIYNKVYPIGCLYWSSDLTSPETLFGGTWEQITDTFILAKGSTFEESGGSPDGKITLDYDNIPPHYHSMSHTHPFSGTTENDGVHSHNIQYGSYPRRDGNGGASVLGLDSWHSGIIKDSGTHAHKFSGTTGTPNQAHTGTTPNAKSATSFSIMPPYVSKYCWERTALA